MSKLIQLLSIGVYDEMRLSERSRLKIVNGSILIASVNILLYNITFFFFAREIAFEMSFVRTLCVVAILSAWWLNKKQKYNLSIHVLLLSSMLSIFHSAYFYLGPAYGYQKFYIIFSMIPFIYFTKDYRLERMFYAISNMALYFYIENASFDYLFTSSYKYFNATIAAIFYNSNIVIGLITVIIVMFVYDYIIGRDEDALVEALKTAKYHAEFDYLTDTMNRRSMTEFLKSRLDDKTLKNKPLAVIMWDVDDFKKINDEEGHAQGDIVLKELSKFIKSEFGEISHLSRWGGEEFIIVLDGLNFETAVAIAEKVRDGVASLTFINNRSVTISLGVTSRKADDTFSSLLLRVDHLMYEAKHQGKNKVVSSK